MKNKMKSKSPHWRSMLTLVIIALICNGCVSTFYKPNATLVSQRKMSVRQAKKTLQGQLVYPDIFKYSKYPAVIKLQWDGIEFVFQKERPKEFPVPYVCKFNDMDPRVLHFYETYGMEFSKDCKMVAFYWYATPESAIMLADAVYTLKQSPAKDPKVSAAAFADGAKKYRDMPVKPTLSEDIQKCRIMAEDSFKNKEFEKAVEYYEQGLEIEPLWPQGQYNAALLCAEINDYENAALHMKRYLDLVPDAKNAKEAREKMYLWEEKGKEGIQQKLTGAGE